MAANVQSNFVPNVWAARFVSRLMEALTWGTLVNRNYEGAIQAAGDTVKVPVPATSITVRDYSIDTDIADAELADGSTVDMSVDKQKYYHFYVDDIDRAQSQPNIMDDAMRWAAYQMALQVDNDIRSEVNEAWNIGRRVAAITDALSPASTWVPKFIEALAKATRVFDEANIRGPQWAVVPPSVVEALTVYYATTQASGSIFVPATAEQALRNGFSGSLLGWQLYVTNQVPQGDTRASGTATKAGQAADQRVYLGRGNEAITFANQISESEAYRPEKRFGDAVKGLMVYGVKTVLPARLRFLDIKKAA